MADTLVVRDSVVSVRGSVDRALTAGLISGEAIDAGAPCYIKTSDNKVYMCIDSVVDDADSDNPSYVGFSDRAVAIGQAVTLYTAGTLIHYAAGTLTIGKDLYITDVKGRVSHEADLVTADLGAGTVKFLKHQPVAVAWNASDILIKR